MLLITGGMEQGQLDAAKELTGSGGTGIVDGESCGLEEALSAAIINNYHLLIRRMLKSGGDVYSYTDRLISANPHVCIVMDEIGCGVVPADAFDREYREIVGRTGCLIARQAKAVYRVFCGIPTRLK